MKKEEPIKCVKSATWNLVWKDYRNWTIFIILAAFAASFFLSPLFFISLILYYIFLRRKVHKKFMMDFAAINGFDYKEKLSLDSVRGNIFNFGHSKTISHAISGNHNNQNIRLFNYQARTGHGRNQRTYFFTVFEIFFEKNDFPSIILKAKRRWTDTFQPALKKDTKEIKIEDEFRESFNLFCADGYEIEALQVFTPQTLSFLKEKKLRFSVEMINNRLYIYKTGLVSTQEKLHELYEVAKFIINSLGPLLNRLNNDFEVLHKYYKKNVVE